MKYRVKIGTLRISMWMGLFGKFSIMIFYRDLNHGFSVGKNAIINANEYCLFVLNCYPVK